VAALGAGATFARDGIQDLLRSGYAGSLLNSPQLLQLLPREPLHGWMQLALRGDDAAKQQIALLVLAGSERFVTGSAELTTLWQRAASSHALIAAVRRWAAEARGEEADRMVAMVLDSLDAEKPLPAAGEILALHQQRVAALLPDHVKKRGLKPMLAVALAQSCPLVLFDLLDAAARADQVSVMLAALDGLPRGTDEVAARIDRSLLTCTPQTRQPLLRALIAQGPPALPMLRAHLAPDADLRADLLQALRTAGSQAAYMAPVLGQLLDAGETDPAVLACISRLGGAGLTDAVRRAGTPEQATDLLAAAATDGDPATRTVAMRLLQDRDPARAVAAARSNANHPLAEVRRWAGLILLADHGDEVDASLLQQLFFDEGALLRRRALETLARARVWPQLLGIAATDLLADRDPGVRRAAAAAFAAHPEECPPSRRALTEARAAATDPATVADLDRALAHR